MGTDLRLESYVRYSEDPEKLADFFATTLLSTVGRGETGLLLLVPQGSSFGLEFARPLNPLVPLAGAAQRAQRSHADLTSNAPGSQESTVLRALDAGASPLDVGQGPEETHVVLADPEGGPLCVIAHGNAFLAGTGALGAFASDGRRGLGEFWASVLGWPLVWDEGDETAIQSPGGGPKITWGGDPVAPKSGPNRWHPHVRIRPGADAPSAHARLRGLGARPDPDSPCPAAHGLRHAAWLDPEDNEFCVFGPVHAGVSAP